MSPANITSSSCAVADQRSRASSRSALRSTLLVVASGNSAQEGDTARMLVGRRIVEREALDAVFGQGGAGPQHDEGERLLALDLVGHGNDAGLRDIVVALEQALDLARIDVLAAAHEHVVGAADESVGAAVVAPEHVAGLVPAVAGQDLPGLLGQIEVAGHVGGRANPQLAFADFGAIGSDQTHLDTGLRPADREVRLCVSRPRAERDRTGFRRAVGDDDRCLRERRA